MALEELVLVEHLTLWDTLLGGTLDLVEHLTWWDTLSGGTPDLELKWSNT